jgi:hypothetical protein
VDKYMTGETAGMFGANFRRQAGSAIGEFEEALRALAGEGTARERERVRGAAEDLMKILARVLVRTE